MTTLDWILLSLDGVPGLDIHPSLLEGDVPKCKPQEESANREEVLGWNQEGIHDEKIHKELNSEEELSIAEGAEQAVAIYSNYYESILTISRCPTQIYCSCPFFRASRILRYRAISP